MLAKLHADPRAAGRRWWRILAGGALLGLVLAAQMPTTTSVGLDYSVRQETEPLYQKAIAFIDRDIQMRAVALKAVGEGGTDEQRILRLLDWTNANIRPQPAGLPVVDDHPYHIVVRGYGVFDQAADVLATLAAYAGMPATMLFVRPPGAFYAFAVVKVDGEWRVFDPREGHAFRDREGRLATLGELRSDPALTKSLPAPREAVADYPTLLAALPSVPERLRPYGQMLLRRPLQGLLPDW